MNKLKFAGNWIIATAFALLALAFMSGGGLSLLSFIFGRPERKAKPEAEAADELILQS